jgi:MOSC domain-containing protein YiiM
MAIVHSLVYQPACTEYKSPARYNRVVAESLYLIAGHGIEGDFKAGRNPKRQLNIMSREILDKLSDRGFKTAPGEMGEQIVIRGLDIESLPSGTRLQIGDTAVVELNKIRTPCVWFEEIQGLSHEKTDGHMGMMASVIEAGQIAVGDAVPVLKVIGTT